MRRASTRRCGTRATRGTCTSRDELRRAPPLLARARRERRGRAHVSGTGDRAPVAAGLVVAEDGAGRGRIVYASGNAQAEPRLARDRVGARRGPRAAARGRPPGNRGVRGPGGRESWRPSSEAVTSAARASGARGDGRAGVGKTTMRARDPRRPRAPGVGCARRAHGPRREADVRVDRARRDDAAPPARVRSKDRASSATATPVETDALVVDEASMLDLRWPTRSPAIAPGTRLVLVGDVDRLAERRAGRVLRDVIASGACPACGSPDLPPGGGEPHRRRTPTASTTASPRSRPRPGDERGDFYHRRRGDPEPREDHPRALTTRIPQRFGLDPSVTCRCSRP